MRPLRVPAFPFWTVSESCAVIPNTFNRLCSMWTWFTNLFCLWICGYDFFFLQRLYFQEIKVFLRLHLNSQSFHSISFSCPFFLSQNLRVNYTQGSEFCTRSSKRVCGLLSQKFMFVDGDKSVSGSYRWGGWTLTLFHNRESVIAKLV